MVDLGGFADKAKEALSGAKEQAKDTADRSQGQAKDGLAGLADKAKGLVDPGMVDDVAKTVKDKTPDHVDGAVDAAAEQAKKFLG